MVQRGGAWAGAPPSPLLAVPNVTAHPSTASVPTSYYLMWHYNNCLWTLKCSKQEAQLSAGCHCECTTVITPLSCSSIRLLPGDNVFIITRYVADSSSCSPDMSSKLLGLRRGRRGALATRRPVGPLGRDLAALAGSRRRLASDKFRRPGGTADPLQGGWTTNKSMRLARDSIWWMSVAAVVAANRHLDRPGQAVIARHGVGLYSPTSDADLCRYEI